MSNVKKPEPVAWVRKHPDGALTNQFLEDGVIETARKQSGAWSPLITTDQAEVYKDACVREALEQAAQELERRRNLLINQNVVLDIKEGVAMYDLCAGAIRALIPKQ